MNDPNYGYGYGGPPQGGYVNPQQAALIQALMMGQQGGYERAWLYPNEIPARVVTAVVFLRDLTVKTDSKIGVTGEGISAQMQEFEGQKLADCEKDTQRAACELLEKYFTGEMALDPYEGLRFRGGQVNLGPNGVPGELPPGGMPQPCPACQERASRGVKLDAKCKYCKGTQGIVIFPLPESGRGG